MNLFKKISSQKGYTLAELLVVIAIFCILIVLIFSVYLLSQKAYYTGDAKAEIDQNGRIAFDRLSREIRQAKEIVTLLPDNEEDPPVNELEFEDGHTTGEIHYIRYYLDGTDLRRQIIYYYFMQGEDKFYVKWNTQLDGTGPTPDITEDRLTAEYVETLEFCEPDAINMYAKLKKGTVYLYIKSKIFGRNLK